MSYKLEENAEGQWDWQFFSSAYGLAMGTEETQAKAIVELLIGEAAVMESPYAPSVKAMMRAEPERVAADFP